VELRSSNGCFEFTFCERTAMTTATKKKLKLFHATMHVTRIEEWCVEAATPEEARAMLAKGHGHRCNPGESLHAEVEELLEK
jgi:hypothetical protein